MKQLVLFFSKLFHYNDLPDREEIQKRSILIFLILLTIFFAGVYVSIYISLGVPVSTIPVMLYATFSFLNLLWYKLSKKYSTFRNVQLVGILLFPLITHIFTGTIDNNSAVVLPAIMSPLGALMFHNVKTAKILFFLFLAVIAAAVTYDYFYGASITTTPKGVKAFFYFFNIASSVGISFFLMSKFVSDNEEFKIKLMKANDDLLSEKIKIEEILEELKATQSQLIQSEKLASLGELTAGIAHEIQNPLNFVNNFSEINQELLIELVEELEKGNLDEVKEIIKDIVNNEQKINQHGTRAEFIVKGMLQHSRHNTGAKEITDVNNLCDEYLRLSYHGLRAKDKSFNAIIETDFAALPDIKLNSQDIGRVILNIITNALHAVRERSKKGEDNYQPTVKVTTKMVKDLLEISIKDNGTGIPDAIKSKIFQPFFTTKPTGEGTGLGLSLSYDIVKSNGGDIIFESVLGEGTTFKIII